MELVEGESPNEPMPFNSSISTLHRKVGGGRVACGMGGGRRTDVRRAERRARASVETGGGEIHESRNATPDLLE